jgi:sugar fermentation stimulation protein A
MDIPMHGVYILVMQLQRRARLTVGHLGIFDFPVGYYFYVGSAMSGFAGRINRHLRRKKKMRWHIDYLLEVADLMWVDLFETGSHEDECRLNRSVAKLPGATIIAPNFGSSDCRCRTHLHYFEELPAERPKL